jgi:hypothetical protein
MEGAGKTQPQNQKEPLQIPLDEISRLRVQNAQLQLRILNDQISAAMVEFARNRGINLSDWQLDLLNYVLIRRPVEQKAESSQESEVV